MITIRVPRFRLWLAELDVHLRRLLPEARGELAHAAMFAASAAAAVRHQYQAGMDAHPHARVLRDGRGRRLRASAYGNGPRKGKSQPPGVGGPWLPAGLKVAVVVMIALTAFLGSSQAYIDYAADLPDAHAITADPLPEDTLIYSSDGTILADIHPLGVQHYYEPIDRMGRWLPEAAVAIEDSNFYNEPGIDVTAIARAAWIDWREKKPVQGASTITQQLVKLRLLDSKQTLDRKAKEIVLALQVEHTYTKRQILEQYLNTVHYGNNSQGSLAASRVYFHRDTKDLDLAQAAMLAGIPQSPRYNSPMNNWEVARGREKQVLDAMVRTRRITQEQADEAFAEDLRPESGHMFRPQPQVLAAPGFSGWIVDQLRAKYGDKLTYGGGLRVTTTLNMKLQGSAERAIVDEVNTNRWRNLTQGAMVALDPRTGAVLAMVGAADPNQYGGQFNMAVGPPWAPPRNPGSSMKIWNYTAAIESGKYTMVTPVQDSPLTVRLPPGSDPATYQPKNYDQMYHGTCQLQQCMGNSLNVPAVKVELSIGVDKVVDAARRVGAPPYQSHPGPNKTTVYSADDPPDTFGYSLTLGGYGETPLQQATGAATIAAMGVYHRPYGIASIRGSDGSEVFKADPNEGLRKALDPKVAYIMQTIMSDDDNRAAIFGRGSPLTLPGRRVAAKTGTTDDFTDAWTVGYTPSLASAFWFGNPNYTPMTRLSDAIFVAAPAWQRFMREALDAMAAPAGEWFSEPPGLGHASVGGKTIYLLPGTSVGQPAPPLPPFAVSGPPPGPRTDPPRPEPPKPAPPANDQAKNDQSKNDD